MADKMTLLLVSDNLPLLLNRITPGMPIRLSGDDVKLLGLAVECIADEVERRSRVGRKPLAEPSPKTAAQRKWRLKK